MGAAFAELKDNRSAERLTLLIGHAFALLTDEEAIWLLQELRGESVGRVLDAIRACTGAEEARLGLHLRTFFMDSEKGRERSFSDMMSVVLAAVVEDYDEEDGFRSADDIASALEKLGVEGKEKDDILKGLRDDLDVGDVSTYLGLGLSIAGIIPAVRGVSLVAKGLPFLARAVGAAGAMRALGTAAKALPK